MYPLYFFLKSHFSPLTSHFFKCLDIELFIHKLENLQLGTLKPETFQLGTFQLKNNNPIQKLTNNKITSEELPTICI
jgi:hypothetical protein